MSLRILTRNQMALLIALAGVFVGGGLLFLYQLRFTTYLGDDTSACVNCHIMAPYYATWQHSSHGRNATCNDCHVPHENMIRKYAFKGTDGMRHVGAFLAFSEPQSPAARDASAEVIMDNCIRCHEQLVTNLAGPGRYSFMMTKTGEGKACWDCHRDVPHAGRNSLSSAPAAIVPYAPSPVPEWLQGLLNNKKANRYE